ncbi:MAG: hypothetical protein ABSH49_12055 [Bryobacteraceae bacterium]|jgi:hypothetical protein
MLSEKQVATVRWIARFSALAVTGGFFFLFAGKIFEPHAAAPASPLEWFAIACLVMSILGMLVAWQWELPGALISLCSLGAFVSFVHMRVHLSVYLMAIPGVLFLADWILRATAHLRAAR